jgi:hypothetical protein
LVDAQEETDTMTFAAYHRFDGQNGFGTMSGYHGKDEFI